MTSNDYNVLSDVMKSLQRIEDKLDGKIDKIDVRVTELEHFKYNLMGKIGMGVLLVGGVVTFAMNFLADWIRSKI